MTAGDNYIIDHTDQSVCWFSIYANAFQLAGFRVYRPGDERYEWEMREASSNRFLRVLHKPATPPTEPGR